MDAIWQELNAPRAGTVGQRMGALIDICEGLTPHSDWSRLRELPYDGDRSLQQWLERLAPPRDLPLRGLWFGLFNPCEDGLMVADVHLNGSTRWSTDPQQWAVRPDWYGPEEAGCHILRSLGRIAYEDLEHGLTNDAEYPLCLGYTCFEVRRLLTAFHWWNLPRPLHITVGFDSGDWIDVGTV